MTPIDLEALRGHTPAPWTFEAVNAYWISYLIRGGEKQNQIAQTFNWQDKGFDASSEANSHLIAIAPTLLSEYERLTAELTTRRARDAEVEALVARWRQHAEDVGDKDATDEAISGALKGCADDLANLTGAKP